MAILDAHDGRIIGSSRFTGYDADSSLIEIVYTFLMRQYWGKGHNRELKTLMLDYTFKSIEKVHFYIGETNHRSRRATEKLGEKLLRSETQTPMHGETYTSVIYEIVRQSWQQSCVAASPREVFRQPALATPRLLLEPIVEAHADEMWALFGDSDGLATTKPQTW